ETSADYQNLVDQVNTDLGIRKRIRHRNVVLLLARVFTPRPLEYKIVVGVANGIEYLHHGVTLNVTHQDLKPNNILLDQDIEAGIADFGLAMPILDYDLVFWVLACLQDNQVAIKKIVLGEPHDTSDDYQNLVDQVNVDTEIGKRIRHRNIVPLLACVSTP
ncbi:leucine-rich repeat receptor-like serine/threonine/tyrosine-protein kinase SOBIR1, partial [Tanacetum coccineum]